MAGAKLPFAGTVLAVQPRIRLLRSFDQRHHAYHGYVLSILGEIGGQASRPFTVGVGKTAHAKHLFRLGDIVSGECQPIENPELETAQYYKASKLKVEDRRAEDLAPGPPFYDVAPPLEEYRRRGHRRLDPQRYEEKCFVCTWGCEMPVEMIIDQWNPSNKRYRKETFCYGPDDCPLYKAGPKRVVPGRKGMKWTEDTEDRDVRRE